MATLQRIKPDWVGEPCIVAAPGPSLTADVVRKCRMARWMNQWRLVAVQDSYRVMPFADALYGCDAHWWDAHKDCAGFRGEKWSTHEPGANDKTKQADEYGVLLVAGRTADEFSLDPGVISYGSNSGFQALNLALLKGSRRIVLVGFDMRHVNGQPHFFGPHRHATQSDDATYRRFATHFERGSKSLPRDAQIVNATPGSALTCFPFMDLDQALRVDAAKAS